jgi:hypothetical protein
MAIKKYYRCLSTKCKKEFSPTPTQSGKFCSRACYFDHRNEIGAFESAAMDPILLRTEEVADKRRNGRPPKRIAPLSVKEPEPVVNFILPDPQTNVVHFGDLSINDLKLIVASQSDQIAQQTEEIRLMRTKLEAYKIITQDLIVELVEIELLPDEVTLPEEEELPVEPDEPEPTPVPAPVPKPEKPQAEHPCATCGEETGSSTKVFCSDKCAVEKIPAGSAIMMNDGKLLTKPAKRHPNAITKPDFISSADFDRIMAQKLKGLEKK